MLVYLNDVYGFLKSDSSSSGSVRSFLYCCANSWIKWRRRTCGGWYRSVLSLVRLAASMAARRSVAGSSLGASSAPSASTPVAACPGAAAACTRTSPQRRADTHTTHTSCRRHGRPVSQYVNRSSIGKFKWSSKSSNHIMRIFVV